MGAAMASSLEVEVLIGGYFGAMLLIALTMVSINRKLRNNQARIREIESLKYPSIRTERVSGDANREEGEYERLGSNKNRQSEAHIIAATNRDLLEDVKSGKFRKDLFYS